MNSSSFITSKKELASELKRSPRYVGDMCRSGFRLPCRVEDAVEFLHRHPCPSRARAQRRKRSSTTDEHG
jgi:hypothetical protein